MLHIILTILKIIGLIIVWILGILLALLILILASAFRYRFQVSYDSQASSQASGSVLVRYLLCFLLIRASYQESVLRYEARILGYPIITNDPDICACRERRKEAQNARKKAKKSNKNTKPGKTKSSRLLPPSKRNNDMDERQTESLKDKRKNDTKSVVTSSKDTAIERIKQEKEAGLPELQYGLSESTIEDTQQSTNTESAIEESIPAGDRLSYLTNVIHVKKLWKRRKKAPSERVKTPKRSIRLPKLPQLPKLHLAEKWTEFKDWRSWILSPSTKEALALVKCEIFRLLKYLLPRSVRGSVRYGFDDPSVTGQVLGIVSLFLPLYHDKIKILPDFQSAILQVNVRGKGHIRPGYLLLWGVRLLFNSKLRNKIKEIKGRLGGNEHVSE